MYDVKQNYGTYKEVVKHGLYSVSEAEAVHRNCFWRGPFDGFSKDFIQPLKYVQRIKGTIWRVKIN